MNSMTALDKEIQDGSEVQWKIHAPKRASTKINLTPPGKSWKADPQKSGQKEISIKVDIIG